MQQSFQVSSNIKVIPPLDIVNAQNQDKFKMILDRLGENVLGNKKFEMYIQTGSMWKITKQKPLNSFG